MDQRYEPCEIYEAERKRVLAAVSNAMDSQRSRRGAFSMANFKNLGNHIRTRDNGPEDALWSNR